MTIKQELGKYLVGVATAISFSSGVAYAQEVVGEPGLPGEMRKNMEPLMPLKHKTQPTSSGQTCEPPQVCATPTPARKKSSGPSKAVKDLRLQVGTLQQKDSQLEGTLSTYGRMFNLMKDRLEGHLQGYEALKQQVDALASNPSSRVLGEVFRGGVTPSKNVMEAACRNSANAYKTFADGEVNYQSSRQGLLGKISAAATNTSYTPMQQAAEAGKFKKELDALDAQHKKGKDGTDKVAALCLKAETRYDAQVKAFEDRKKELEERVKRNLTRAGRLLLEVGESYVNNDGTHQAMTSARLGYEGKKLRFWGEAGTLYGQAQQQTSSLSTLPQTTVVGPNHQDVTWQEGTMTEETRYHTALALGVEKGWLVGKRKRVELSLGARAAAYLGERTTTNEVMNYSQLQDLNGNDVGQLLSAAGRTVEREALHDLVLGLEAGVSRLFWDRYAASLRLSPQYNVSKETFVPALTLGLGARF